MVVAVGDDVEARALLLAGDDRDGVEELLAIRDVEQRVRERTSPEAGVVPRRSAARSP